MNRSKVIVGLASLSSLVAWAYVARATHPGPKCVLVEGSAGCKFALPEGIPSTDCRYYNNDLNNCAGKPTRFCVLGDVNDTCHDIGAQDCGVVVTGKCKKNGSACGNDVNTNLTTADVCNVEKCQP